jgi:hypothetical protein
MCVHAPAQISLRMMCRTRADSPQFRDLSDRGDQDG